MVESTWPSVRLKFLGRFKGGAGFPHDEQGNQTAELPFYKVRDLGQSASDSVLRETENYIARDTAQDLGAFIFPSGTIVFAKVGAALLLSRFRVLSRPACIDNNMMGFMPNPQICDISFTLSALNLLDFSSLVNPGAVPSLNEEQIAEQTLPLPPLPKQRAIANFLDRETSKLDSLVAAKEQLLALLAEKRRALITHAVTRGINPNASLRNSGSPWLGEIPAHWETERAKWLFSDRDVRSETGEEEMLTVSHITGVTPRSEKNVNMFEAESTEGYKVCYAGDLVINTLWAWMGAMGVSPIHGIVSPAYHIYTPCERLDPAYVDMLVRIPVFAEEAIRFSKGVWSSRLRLYPEGFYEIYLPVPPRDEQRAIVAHLASETIKIDALRAAAERTIALSKERRAALISAAVTGKIKTPSLFAEGSEIGV